MSDYLTQGCTNPITAIDVTFDVKWVDHIRTEKRNLRLEKEVDSVQYFKDDRCSATVKNGKILAFSNVSENPHHFVPTLFEVALGEDGYLKIIMKEGATRPQDNILLEGKYVDFELVEGRKTKTSEDYYNRLNIVEVEEGEFANGNLIQGLKRITKTSQRKDLIEKSALVEIQFRHEYAAWIIQYVKKFQRFIVMIISVYCSGMQQQHITCPYR